jgi:eukaryotic-like serine/threonine-protein kinase
MSEDHPGPQSEPAERFRQADALFDAALDLPPPERGAFIDAACAHDPDLRRDIHELLRAHEASAPFFDAPAVAFVAPLLHAADLTFGPLAGTRLPERVGPFRLVREIGRGGMGAVFLAERDDGQFEQRVALKLIRHAGAVDLVPRFLEERRILARFEHPRIARLVDGGITDDGLPWFAMEYVDGEPIDRYCDARTLSITRRLELFADMCDAVQYAHQRFVVHRDLKPSNIFVTTDGQLKLLDFGVAKLLDPIRTPDDAAATDSLVRAMTPEYAAPEQIRGEPATAATDVYALGVLLYALLTGQRPYEVRGRSPAQVERIICELDPARPSATLAPGNTTEEQRVERARCRGTTPDRLCRALGGDLDTIVLKALGKEPEARYASAYQLARDVRRHLTGHPVLARRQTAGYRARRFVKRHRIEVLAASAITLTLIAGAVLSVAQARNARAERDRAQAASKETDATNTFLLRLFEASDPADAQGDSLTARELVRRAAARVDQLHGEPAEQSRLLVVTARLDESLGQFGAARVALERALALRERGTHSGDDDQLAAADVRVRLSRDLLSLGQFAAADSVAHRALSVQERRLGPEHPTVAATLHQLGSIAVYRGDLGAAESYHRRALAVRERTLGVEDSLTADSHLLVGSTLRREGKLSGAERELREGLAISERVLGPDAERVSSAVGLLASLLDEDEGRLVEAEPLYRRELEMRRRVYGDGRPETAWAVWDLADFLSRVGRGVEAVPLARQFLASVRHVYGPDHPITANATAQAALVLHQSGRLADAEPLFRQAIAMDRRLRGDDDQNVAGAEINLARLLIDRRDFAGARQALTDAVRISEKLAGSETPIVAVRRGVEGLLLLREGRYTAADSVLRHAIQTVVPQIGRQKRDVRELYGWLADAEEAQGRHAEAAQDRAIATGR